MKKLLAALALALLAAQMGVEATGGDKSKAPTYSKYSLSAQTYLPVSACSVGVPCLALLLPPPAPCMCPPTARLLSVPVLWRR